MKSNKLTIGILAHVDAGKTTLSEIILYLTGSIRTIGRVDHKDAFLDTFELEKARGITIFSKQAEFSLENMDVTLLDTPGHVDFSSEMERTLQVLDYGILVINGADGIQGHTQTLWTLLNKYKIPTFIFVNKMDQNGTNRQALLTELQERFNEECIDFGKDLDWQDVLENISMSDDKLLDKFMETDNLDEVDIVEQINSRKVFPVYFGSALKNTGVEDLLEGINKYAKPKKYTETFGARVFKISRDPQGTRLTHMKITGGSIGVKETIEVSKSTDEIIDEKIDQIRIYSGKSFEPMHRVEAGTVCVVTGLSLTKAGDGLGFEKSETKPILKPVLSYQMVLEEDANISEMIRNLRQLEEEEPHLDIEWNENLGEIHIKVMGEIELEILKSLIKERFNVNVTFDSGNLVYKETIKTRVIGVGHFEPLRHYSEAHLLLEPNEPGKGMEFFLDCSEDILARNWQRLILTHLKEKEHVGVLTGSEITDMKISVVAGRAHNKHTEGGDFRQATFRAIRQGLMKAESVLLEPVYEFRLEVPKEYIGRGISDVEKMYGRYSDPEIDGEDGILEGIAPVATMMHYLMEVNTYTKGKGRLYLNLRGYEPCHNSEEIIESFDYDPDEDLRNLSSSVFCKKGTGFSVPWNQVEDYMHVESELKIPKKKVQDIIELKEPTIAKNNSGITDNEINEILQRTYGPSKEKNYGNEGKVVYGLTGKVDESYSYAKARSTKRSKNRDQYLLVDGYNIVFSWSILKGLAEENLDLARYKLMDILCNYQSLKHITVIVVFDAYKVKGNHGSTEDYNNISVVYTKEAETADQYIEKLVNVISPGYDVTVATSDVLEQIIIMGKGAKRLTAEGFKLEVDHMNQEVKEKYINKNKSFNQSLPKIDLDKDR